MWLRDHWKGLMLTFFMTNIAFILNASILSLNVVVLGFLLGIITGNLNRSTIFTSGLKFSSGPLLETAIVLLAFQIDFFEILKVGFPILIIIISTISFILFLTFWLVKKMNYSGNSGYLVGFGTAICGSAAIAALGPLVSKDKSEIGIATAVVNLIGGLGIFLIPWLAGLILSDDTQTGILIGGSLHAMGHVAGSAALVNSTAGGIAIAVKLVRISLLTPALFIFRKAISKKGNPEISTAQKLPTYLFLFLGVVVLNSTFDIPKEFLAFNNSLSTSFLTAAMFAIGFGVQLSLLIREGTKAFLFGILLFILMTSILIGLIFLLNPVP